MSSGRKPVASFYKRSVYKTEFDLFKKNTDLDLISLLSYDEGPPISQETEKNIEYGTKATERRNHKSSLFQSRSSSTRAVTTRGRISNNVRQRGETYSHGHTRPRPQRTCKSAFGLTTRIHVPDNGVTRSKSSYGSRKCQYTGFCKPNVNKDTANICTLRRTGDALSQQKNTDTRNYPKQGVSSAPRGYNKTKSFRETRPKTTSRESFRGRSNVPPRETKSSLGRIKTETAKSINLKEDLSTRILCKLGRDIKDAVHTAQVKPTLSRDAETTNSDISEISGDYKGIFDETQPTATNYNTEYFVNIAYLHGKSASKDSGFCSSTVSPEHELDRGVHLKDLQHENNDGVVAADNVYDDFNERKRNVIKGVESDDKSDDICILSDSLSELSGCDLDDCKKSDWTNKSLAGFLDDLSVIENGENIFEVFEPVSNIEEDSIRSNGSLYDEVIQETTVSHSTNIVFENTVDETEGDKDTVNQNMSSEARHAILETLHDMRRGGKDDKENSSVQMLHKSVSSKRRLKNNRHQYDMYMRERTNTMIRESDKMIDEGVNKDDSYGSTTILDLKKNKNFHEETARGNLFPSISAESKSTINSNKSSVYTLEHAKKKKYKIPGIGNYHLVMSPEQDFEITPPGFDIRYNTGPAISKEEMEPPPKFIQDRSIQKCKNWLKNVNLSPLSLKPSPNKR